MTVPLKTTPLIKEHQKLQARFIDFYGWKLPLKFGSNTAREEHLNVRRAAGLFDISYMSKIRVIGPTALQALEKLLTNNIRIIQKNQSQYNLLCNEKGGIIDDLIVYCMKFQTEYLLIGNGSRQDKVYQWIKDSCSNDREVTIQDESQKWAMMALQGPASFSILQKILQLNNVRTMKKRTWQFSSFLGDNVMMAATGYTGEKGFELLLPSEKASNLWQAILKQGKEFNCLPVGLAARDTLRLEMKYPLYGVDLNEDIDPYSANLAWVVKNSAGFIGKEALMQVRYKIQRKWIGFQIKNSAGLPRRGMPIWVQNKRIGEVTSGAMSPCLNYIIGTGYVDSEYSHIGQMIQIEVHQSQISAEIVATPFIKK